MGAHFALHAATQLNIKFEGLILHNCAATNKKSGKLTPEQKKNLDSFIPTNNLKNAETLFLPTMIIHTSTSEKLDSSHYERLKKNIPDKFLVLGKKQLSSFTKITFHL